LMNTIKSVLGPGFGQYQPTANKEKGLIIPPMEVDNTMEADNTADLGSGDSGSTDVIIQETDETNEQIPVEEAVVGEDQDVINPGLGGESSIIGIKTELSSGEDDETEYKVVCYYTNWAWYRPGIGKYQPDDIDSNQCTHIVYGFAVLNPTTLTIRAHDSWADFDNEFYKKVTALKSKKKKVLLALGGWNDSAGNKYSRLVNNPEARRKFIEHATKFIEDNNFDGLDLDWEYPKCWQVDCGKGPESDKKAFADWVQELSEAFKPRGLLLTAAVSPSNKVMDAGYDIPRLNKYFDYISIMTYDYHGQWDKKTGHVAPMYQHPDDDNMFFNVNFTVNYWLEGGLSRKKLIMGMPLYGQSFTLENPASNGLNARTYGGGTAGQFTRARGFLAYYEICHNIQNKGWKVIHDPEGRMGPYAYKGKEWVSFDDVAMIKYKSQFIKNLNLGGAMIWALDLDDFNNRCGCQKHPLLNTINSVLRGFASTDSCQLTGNYRLQTENSHIELTPSPYDSCSSGPFTAVEGDCSKYRVCNNMEYEERQCPPGLHWNRDRCDWPANSDCGSTGSSESVTPGTSPVIAEWPEPDITDGFVDGAAEVVEPFQVPEGIVVPENGKKIVCYYTNWAWYRQGLGKYRPEDIDYTLCTHINYGFAVLDEHKLIMAPHDTWADIDNEFFKKVAALKQHGVKVSIALGGWNDSEGDKYSRMVNDANARKKFITNAIEFIEKWGFEGLDLDWEYPKCWQVDCSKGPDSDKEAFSALVRELSAEFKPRGWILSAAVSPSKTVMDAGYDIPALNQYLDIINVMTYDYHGHWDKKTGHVAPLYEYPEDDFYFFNANFTMNYWHSQGADKSKLVMGMPMYGQSFTLADTSDTGLNSDANGRGEAGDFTRAGGFLAYYEICHKIRSEGWIVERDIGNRLGPIAHKGSQWVGFDDIAMIRRKSQYVMDSGFGGGMIWALDLDDFANRCGCEKYPLLKTMNRIIRNYPSPDPGCDTTNPLFYSGYSGMASQPSPYFSQQSTIGFNGLTSQTQGGILPASTQILVPTNSQYVQPQPSFRLTSQMYQQPLMYQQPQMYYQPTNIQSSSSLEPTNTQYQGSNWEYKSLNQGLSPISMPGYQFWYNTLLNQLPQQKQFVV